MSFKNDFPCSDQDSSVLKSEIIKTLNLQFPDAYCKARSMARFSKALQQSSGTVFCEIPLCHTVEAEALGADITPGDAFFSPRCRKPVFSSLDDFDALPGMDFSEGLLKEVLSACRILSDAGENVVLELSGPFTIAGALIDLGQIFRGLRQSPEKILHIFNSIGKMQLSYAQKAVDCGVSYISYGDAPGAPQIIGPAHTAFVAKNFTFPFLKELSGITSGHAMLLLCPQTAFSLTESSLAAFHDVPLPKAMTYQEACIHLLGSVAITGETCMKNTTLVLPGVFKELRLTQTPACLAEKNQFSPGPRAMRENNTVPSQKNTTLFCFKETEDNKCPN